MIEHRPFDSLGRFRLDWLNARHHFSFGEYVDRERMGHGLMRVWNDDEIRPGTGFDPHPHKDMEIVTYVREGAITHRDNLGNEGRTEAGQVQVMSAGTGIVHAEYNLEDRETRLFQIWIRPDRPGHAPRWETRPFPRKAGRLEVLASGRAQDRDTDAPIIHQDAAVLGGLLNAGQTIDYPAKGRHVYLVASKGRLRVNGVDAGPRDGMAVFDEPVLSLEALEDAEVVLVDTP